MCIRDRYDPDYKELDGGQLDNPDLSLVEAGKEILAIHERPDRTMEPLTGDALAGFLEAAEQANAIPQPQAWNGIDGLLTVSYTHLDVYKRQAQRRKGKGKGPALHENRQNLRRDGAFGRYRREVRQLPCGEKELTE